jgi:hypothetical protein
LPRYFAVAAHVRRATGSSSGTPFYPGPLAPAFEDFGLFLQVVAEGAEVASLDFPATWRELRQAAESRFVSVDLPGKDAPKADQVSAALAERVIIIDVDFG